MRVFKKLFFPLQDIKAVKTKNKKGEIADGKKKAKKEPEEKWKWLVTAEESARPRLGVSLPLAIIFQVGRRAIHRWGQMEVPGTQRTSVRTTV